MLDLSTPPLGWPMMHGLNLSSCLRRFLYNGLSSSTRATYRGAQVSYENFCAREGFPTWPAKRIPIAEWLAYRAMGSLDEPAVRPNVLRQYLSHLRSVHVDRCYSVRVFDENALFLRVLEGVSRLLPPAPRLPPHVSRSYWTRLSARSFSAAAANACMLATRSALPVSSVIARSTRPATAMQACPGESP